MATTIAESGKETPVVHDTDVLVCGGGPAGIAAAVAAARQGALVHLVELHGCLGGVWTAGKLSHIIDYDNKTGIMAEIMDRLQERGASGPDYDVEVMKRLLDELCLDAGVQVRLQTRVVDAVRTDDGEALAAVITESKSGREAWQADVFVDATGDGDLAARAGCAYEYGHPETDTGQPMSLMGLISGVRAQDIDEFIVGPRGHEAPKDRLLGEFEIAGIEPSYGRPTIFQIHRDLFALMANHEYDVSPFDADEISEATLRARKEVNELVDALRSLGGVWTDLRLVGTGAQLGVREGRRIRGLYEVDIEDIAAGVEHEDAICRVNFVVDVHSLDPEDGTGYEGDPRSQPYDIPLRALITRDVEGLLLAGRCISGDFLAHASYRVTGNAVAMGEAAGVTAAIAADRDEVPRELPWEVLEPHLPAVER